MTAHLWTRLPAALLTTLLAAGGAARADDDDDFEKRFRKQQRKYEDQRREAAKRFAEQQREAVKREDDRRRRLDEQYRDDLKRQERWQQRADRDARERFEDQLRRQARDARRLPDFGPVPGFPPPPPAFGQVPDATWLPAARRSAAEFGPQFARLLGGLGAGRGLDPRAAAAAADLARRAERLADLGRREADLATLRREYAGLDAGWQQLTPYLDRAAADPAGRDLAWQVYQAERQLRQGVGYAPLPYTPNWATAAAAARELTAGYGQLVGVVLRTARVDQSLAFDLRNAQQVAQELEGLIAQQAGQDQLRQQHEYLGAVTARSAAQLRVARLDAAGWAVVRRVVDADRLLCAELGIPVYQDDAARGVGDRVGELAVAADRLRRELWAALGRADPQAAADYLRPADQLAARADLLAQMARDGRPPELVQGGWPGIEELTQAVGQRVGVLDRGQFEAAHRLLADVGRLVQELRPAFAPAAVPPVPPVPGR